MTVEQPKVVALSGGVGGAKLVVGLARKGRAGPAPGDRQWRRRLRASGAHDLPGCRHAALCRKRSRQPEARLGPARRDLDLHGRARRSRRALLVPARRRRSRSARPAQRAVARGRAFERDHGRSAQAPGRFLSHRADERRSGQDVGRDRRRQAPLPGLVRRAALRAQGQRPRLRRRQRGAAGAGPGRGAGRRRARGDRDLPLESPDQRGADPGGERTSGCDRAGQGAGRRGLAAGGRSCAEGTRGQDDGRARPRQRCAGDRALLHGPDRRADHRRGRMRTRPGGSRSSASGRWWRRP